MLILDSSALGATSTPVEQTTSHRSSPKPCGLLVDTASASQGRVWELHAGLTNPGAKQRNGILASGALRSLSSPDNALVARVTAAPSKGPNLIDPESRS